MTKHLENIEPSNSAKPVLSEVYDEILKMYIGKDELRNWLCNAFSIGNFAMATNTTELIFFNKELIKSELIPCQRENPQIILNNIPQERNQSFVLDIEKIEECFKNIPLIDATKEVGQNIKCSECLGEGTVEWEYERWTKDFDCPKCDGDGYESVSKLVKTGKKEIDRLKLIDIKNSRFSVSMVDKLLKVRNLLNEKEITLVYQNDPIKSTIFKIGNVEVLCMPMVKTESNNEEVVLELI